MRRLEANRRTPPVLGRNAQQAAGGLGAARLRDEDEALLRGQGRFVDDVRPAGCLSLAFARSTHASGLLTDIDLGPALDSPGVIAAFTAGDMTLAGPPSVNPVGGPIALPDFEWLASGTVRAVGQPVAMVIAESPAAARDAAELVGWSVEGASATSSPRPFQRHWSSGDTTAAFAAARHVVEASVVHPKLAPLALEPRAALAQWEPEHGSLTLWLSTQTPHRAREEVARLLQLPPDRVRVIAPDVGGAFGGKASISPEDVMVAWAARRLGRPVKWCATRSEEFLAAPRGRGGRSHGRLALDRNGRCLALEASFAFDLGWWLPFSASVPAHNAGRILPGPYDIENVRIEAHAELRNEAAIGIYRGAGRPEAAMLMERLMDEAAATLGLDPMEIRRRNAIPATRLPMRTPTGQTLCSGDFRGLLDKVGQLAGYAEACAERDRARKAGAVTGVGVALYVEPCGQGWETASVRLSTEGRILAALGSTAQGQGRATAARQIVADAVGVPAEAVIVAMGDTGATPVGVGALASRGTPIGGSALLLAARAFRQKVVEAASKRLGVSSASIILGVEGCSAPGRAGSLLPWASLAGEVAPADITFHAEGEAWASGACIATVAIDRATGVLTVGRLAWVDDAGTVVNPMLVEGQLIGGMAQGFGEAVMERLVLDGEGQLLTGSLMDYAVPRARDVPPLALASAPTPTPMNPLGAKGVGEAGCIGVPAAIANAVHDALRPFGARDIDMPFTAQTLWRALRKGAIMNEGSQSR